LRPPGGIQVVIVPGEGLKPASGSSALIRHSIEWPSIRISSCRHGSRSPAATRIRFHQVEPGDLFRDRMLDLDARVHLHEVEAAARVEQEFDGAGVHVVRLAAERAAARAAPAAPA
jgi:hypothetical protein